MIRTMMMTMTVMITIIVADDADGDDVILTSSASATLPNKR